MFSRYKSDGKIVGEVLKGRVDEFELLVRRYLAAARAIAASRVGNTQDIEDLVQETFLKAFQALDSLRDPEKFAPWVACTARNTCANFVRERKKEPQRVEFSPMSNGSGIAVEKEELYRLVRERLQAMDKESREILLLHYYAGKSSRKMAGFLGLSREAVKKRLQRAREVLGKELAPLLEPVAEEEQRWDRQSRTVMGLLGVNVAPWLNKAATAGAAAAAKASFFPAIALVASIVFVTTLSITAAIAIQRKNDKDALTIPASDSRAHVSTEVPRGPAQDLFKPEPQKAADATGTVAGRVVLADSGQPVPNAGIKVQFYRAALWHTKADAKGEFRIEHFPPGMFSLDIDDPELILVPPCFYDLSEGSQLTDIVMRVQIGGIITGRVFDKETGQGVAGVEIHTTQDQINDRKTISAEDGVYRLAGLPERQFTLSYEPPPGYAASLPKHIHVAPGQVVENIDFPLGKGVSISGKLVDASDQPLGGLTLTFDGFTTRITSDSASDGSFVAKGLPLYSTVRCQLYGEKRRFALPPTKFELKDKDIADVLIKAKETASISGRIVTPEGKGIAKARVSMKPVDPPDADDVFNDIFNQETDAEGAFSEDGIYPGMYKLNLSPPRNADGDMNYDLDFIELQPGQRLVNQRYVYDSGQTLSIAGRIVDTDGNPLPNVRLTVMAPHMVLYPETDATGAFLVTDLKPGQYDLCYFSRSGVFYKGGDKTVQAGDMNIEIVLGPPENPQPATATSETSVNVVDARTDKPVTDFESSLTTELDKSIQEVFEDGYLGLAPVVNPEGHFQVPLQDREYRLVILSTGYAPSISTIRAGGTYKIALTPGMRVTGRVLDPDGKPVEGAVLVRGKRPSQYACSIPAMFSHPLGHSNSEGRFQISNLSAEPQAITAVHPDFGSVSTHVSPNAQNPPDVVFRFPPAGRLEGQITWDGAPVSAILNFWHNDELACTSFAQAGTTYSAPGFPPGPYRLEICAQLETRTRRCSYSQDITVNTGPNHFDYDFVPGATTLLGKATIDGAPITEEFEMRIQYAESGLCYDLKVTPDETGMFRIDQLPPGNVSITARGEYQDRELSSTATLNLPAIGSIEQDFAVGLER